MIMHATYGRYSRVCMLLGLVFFLSGCATGSGSTPPVSVAEIVVWSQAGIPPSEIIHHMENAGMVYRLSAAQLADLHAQGVEDPVIIYMQQTHLDLRKQRLQAYYGFHWH